MPRPDAPLYTRSSRPLGQHGYRAPRYAIILSPGQSLPAVPLALVRRPHACPMRPLIRSSDSNRQVVHWRKKERILLELRSSFRFLESRSGYMRMMYTRVQPHVGPSPPPPARDFREHGKFKNRTLAISRVSSERSRLAHSPGPALSVGPARVRPVRCAQLPQRLWRRSWKRAPIGPRAGGARAP